MLHTEQSSVNAISILDETGREVAHIYRDDGAMIQEDWILAETFAAAPETAADRDALRAENERLRGALEEILKGEGPYSRDHLQHADNCIESMKELAQTALAKGAEPNAIQDEES